MAFRREEKFDADAFAAMLKEIVNRVKTSEDPVKLNSVKKIYKANVPFSLRNYVAAYLAKQGMSNFRRGAESRERGAQSSEKWNKARNYEESSQQKPASARVYIEDEQAATIFVGIGKTRHVFPRDLLGLVMNVAELERDRIGFIRVLENFSFVQLFKEDADKAIEKLNGYDYRGKKLSVSYSKKREEFGGDGSKDMSHEEDFSDTDSTN